MVISKPVPCQAIAVASCWLSVLSLGTPSVRAEWLSRAPAALLVQLHSGAMRINQCLAETQDSCALHRHLLSDRVLDKKKRVGNWRGRPIAHQRTRISWVKSLSNRTDLGGGSDRPCYQDKNRKYCDRHRQHQPALESGLVHFVSSLF